MMKKTANGLKLDYKKTFLIGFGFFATSLAWSLYNANVPLILQDYVSKSSLIGLIMSIDNIFAVLFQPIFGFLSDRTYTKRGRRMPYILIGLPICAVLFTLIPHTQSLVALMAVVIAYNFIMSTWRAPVVALMPDVTPSALRSQANGVINMMGGIGGVFSFLLGGFLLKVGGFQLPFLVSGIVMMLAWVVLFFFVKEPAVTREEAKKQEIIDKKDIADAGDTKGVTISLILLLLAIFFWFTGYNAIETFFTLYATNGLGVSASTASFTLAAFSMALLIFAIPAGFIGAKIGRKKTILLGISGMVILLAIVMNIQTVLIVQILMFAAGICWAFININSLPMVVEIARSSKIGRYTGYYYFFSQTAAVCAPTAYGLIHDATQSYSSLFVFSCVALTAAAVCMLFVRHGEVPVDKNEIDAEVEKLAD
ncbi:MAG: MFS transporter [Oscillospiraceae bacterium]